MNASSGAISRRYSVPSESGEGIVDAAEYQVWPTAAPTQLARPTRLANSMEAPGDQASISLRSSARKSVRSDRSRAVRTTTPARQRPPAESHRASSIAETLLSSLPNTMPSRSARVASPSMVARRVATVIRMPPGKSRWSAAPRALPSAFHLSVGGFGCSALTCVSSRLVRSAKMA